MGYLTEATIDGSDYKLAGALYGTCATAAATAAKVVTCPDFDDFEEGVTIHVKFTYSNTASNATLNVNSKGAKSLCCYGTTRVGTTEKTSWKAGAVVSFTYDGTSWVMNDYIADTGVTTDTKNTAGSTNSTSKLYLIGATSQGANPQTYSNSKVYETDGALVADSYSGVGLADNGNGSLSMYGASGDGYVTFNDIAGSNFVIQGADSTKALTIPASYTLGDACEKDVVPTLSTAIVSNDLPTATAVVDYVDSAVAAATAGGLSYHGVATALTDITDTNYKKGWYWMVGTNPSVTIDGQACEAGDMIIAKQDKTSTADNDLDVIQSNIVALTTAEIDADWAAA